MAAHSRSPPGCLLLDYLLPGFPLPGYLSHEPVIEWESHPGGHRRGALLEAPHRRWDN